MFFMSLFQQALQFLHSFCCLGAGHVAPVVTTDDVQGQLFGAGPSILDPDNYVVTINDPNPKNEGSRNIWYVEEDICISNDNKRYVDIVIEKDK